MKRSRKPATTSDAMWSEWSAEAQKLVEVSFEAMTPEQQDRVDALSDALIHLVGHTEALAREVSSESDRKALKLLRRRVAPPHGALSHLERTTLRQRIVSGLQSAQLRVRESRVPPYERAMESARFASKELMRELEAVHRALVVPELAIAAGVGRELWDVECTTTVDVPDDVARGRHVALRVSGDSMEPLIRSGDLVLVRLEERAAAGTVVVARDPEHGYVVKEVGRLTAKEIELRSLNPAYPVLHIPQSGGTVLGTVVLRWPRR